jgi:hypothetical protein
VVILRYYPGIRMEGPNKTTRNLYQDSRSLGEDFNLGPPKYEAGVLIIQPRHSINDSIHGDWNTDLN